MFPAWLVADYLQYSRYGRFFTLPREPDEAAVLDEADISTGMRKCIYYSNGKG